MNKKIILIAILVNCFFYKSISQIQMNSVGDVGIGISPNSPYDLTINGWVKFYNINGASLLIDQTGYYGLALYPSASSSCSLGNSSHYFSDIYYNTPHQGSDRRIKENIRLIKKPLSIIMNLNGVEYDYTKNYVYSESINYKTKDINKIEKDRKDRLGFIAQDVQKVLPEAVFYDDSTDFYSMDYTRIIPVLVEAMKEQQATIEALQKEVAKLKKGTSKLKSASAATDVSVSEAEVARLSQNAPNPFNQSTNIGYYLPEAIQKALLNIYDMNGVQLRTIAVNQKGEGNVTINASELKPGMYYYTLIADGKEVDTMRMIITE